MPENENLSGGAISILFGVVCTASAIAIGFFLKVIVVRIYGKRKPVSIPIDIDQLEIPIKL